MDELEREIRAEIYELERIQCRRDEHKRITWDICSRIEELKAQLKEEG